MLLEGFFYWEILWQPAIKSSDCFSFLAGICWDDGDMDVAFPIEGWVGFVLSGSITTGTVCIQLRSQTKSCW